MIPVVGVEVADELLYGLLLVVVPLIVALMAYLVRSVGKIDARVGIVEKDDLHHENDINRLDDRVRNLEMKR